ncbi:hypothetical protein QAD02_002146 [Eretmocerus hayati]|uniref:Uncharacterized protein n=1 Tax=Eretmocerus hayati TaxID=131215 RepID=A0ACC2NKZ0_9HYME|nr:hypothetical protein QAD02_002146 [Eretmocerus hayati]
MPTKSQVRSAVRLDRLKKRNLDVKESECMLLEFANVLDEDGKKQRDVAYQGFSVDEDDAEDAEDLIHSQHLVSIIWPTNLILGEESRIKPELQNAVFEKEIVRILAVGSEDR